MTRYSERRASDGRRRWGWFACSECGEEFEARKESVRAGDTRFCAKHRGKRDNTFAQRKYRAGSLVGPKHILLHQEIEQPYKAKKNRTALFQCPVCGELWEARVADIAHGKSTRCYNCHIEGSTRRIIQQNKDNSYNLLGQQFEYLRVNKKIGSSPKDGVLWLCECACGNKTIASSRHLVGGTARSCGCLSHKSKGEIKIAQILTELKIDYNQEYTFEDCRNPKTSRLLRFDFYLPKYNVCIEYDGIQHFCDSSFLGGYNEFQKRVYRDTIKTQYCKQHNIPLIRIKYTEYEALNPGFIKKLLSNY